MGNISEIEYVPATTGTFLVDVRFVFSSYQFKIMYFTNYLRIGKELSLILESLYLGKPKF